MDIQEDPLDQQTMEQLRELGDDEFLAELVDMYLADFEPTYAKLLAAINDGDVATAVSSAHFLKGSSLSLGLLALGGVLAQVEHHYRENAERVSDDTLAEMEMRADQARARLQVLLSETKESGVSGR